MLVTTASSPTSFEHDDNQRHSFDPPTPSSSGNNRPIEPTHPSPPPLLNPATASCPQVVAVRRRPSSSTNDASSSRSSCRRRQQAHRRRSSIPRVEPIRSQRSTSVHQPLDPGPTTRWLPSHPSPRPPSALTRSTPIMPAASPIPVDIRLIQIASSSASSIHLWPRFFFLHHA
ncbi:hypothetical protein ACLOJK_029546 [Asimina triloba]